jgi:hypothetical protein
LGILRTEKCDLLTGPIMKASAAQMKKVFGHALIGNWIATIVGHDFLVRALLVAKCIAVIAVVALQPLPVSAQERVALVIGNSRYANAPALPNTINDAADMAASFRRIGFRVTQLSDATMEQMRRGIRDFGRDASSADLAIVFFAGHGMELGGENFLIPADADISSDRDIQHETVRLQDVLATVSSARRLGLVILDACRNDPFSPKMRRSAGVTRTVTRGLGRVEPSGSVLVAFAAREGTVADDGTGRNSPFTTALLRHIEKPQLEVADLFREVRADVVDATARRQEPSIYGSLGRERVFLAPGAGVRPTPSLPQAGLNAGATGPSTDAHSTEQGPSLKLGVFGRWSVYRSLPNQQYVSCWMTISPVDRDPRTVEMKPNRMFIVARPSEGINNEIAFNLGTVASETAPGQVNIDGSTFAIAPKGQNAWLANAAEESALIEKMKSAKELVLRYANSNSKSLTDVYDIEGFSVGFRILLREC